MAKAAVTFRMRIRIYAGDRMFGPGQMELLAQIKATGSLAGASKAMGMSYMRAWKLVQNLNRDPKRPMVETTRGGAGGGAGKLTAFGEKILALYQRMEIESAAAARPYGKKIADLLV